MSTATAPTSEASPSPSRHLFPKTLRKSKPNRSSKTSSIVEDESSESHVGLRSSLDSAASKLKLRPDDTSSGESSGLKGLLAKAKPKRRRKREQQEAEERAAEEVQRGRSVGERGRLEDEKDDNSASRSQSAESKRTRGSEASRMTYESDEDPLTSPPPLTTRHSHAGYLTHSSPLIQKSPTQPVPTPSVKIEGPTKSTTLPLGTSLPDSTDESPNLAGPKHAATLQATGSSRRRSSFDGRVADDDRGLSPVGKFKEVFKSSSRPSTSGDTSPDPEPQAPTGAAGTLKSLFGKKAEDSVSATDGGTIASRRNSKVPDAPLLKTSGFSESHPKASKAGAPPTTPPGSSETPVTTVTPPTPTLPTSNAGPALEAESNIVTSPSGHMISHRRVRSSSSTNPPSKLSNAVSAPLTPTIEETRSSGGTPGSAERPGSQAGFFSSVLSTAQNAVTTLGNSISSNSLSASGRDRISSAPSENNPTDGTEVISSFASTKTDAAPVNGEAREQKPLAVETLGSGELSLSHLGISTEPSQGLVGTAMSDTSGRPADQASIAPSHAGDNASVHTVGSRAGLSGDPSPARPASAMANDKKVEDVTQGIINRTTNESSLGGDFTPTTTRDWDRESNFRRSGSVRSRTDNSIKRQRGSSTATGNTVAAAIAASHSGLGNSAANGSVPRLTGFAVASKKRNRDFHQTFRSVPDDDYLIEDYSAALQKDILLHGRFYVSEGHICFNSNIFGYVTTLIISFDTVVSIEKKNTAMFIPNGLVIQTLHAKNVFASFTSRDSTYDLLIGIWKISHPNLRSSLNGVELDEAGGGDKTVKTEGAASDEDSEDESGEDEEVYDEDEEEEEGLGSFTEAGDGSIAGSEMGDAAKAVNRKPSGLVPPMNGTANGTTNGEAKSDASEAGAAAPTGDFPGPPAHAPSECNDQDTHYEKIIKDEVIHAPLGKVYAMMFGPASGSFLTKWLVDDQKVMELQLDDDRRGLGDEKKSRSYSYIKPLNGSIGPKQTKCLITEVLDAINFEKAVSVTVTTQTPDVPSGNAFSVKTKYCLMWAEGNGTRVLMNCTIEWTGKSWLKGPIEKGANDGQVAYANDLVSAIRMAVSSKIRGAAGKGKGKRRKKDSSEATTKSAGLAGAAAGAKGPNSASKKANWGLLEPLRGPLGPVADIVSPLISSHAVIGVLVVLLAVSWLRTPRTSSVGGDGRSLAGIATPERIAAYEEIWRGEESRLWDWLEERIAISGPAAPKQAVVGRGMAGRLADEKMSQREVDDAIRVTQQRLDALKRVVQRRKELHAKSAGGSEGGGSADAGGGSTAEAPLP